jgi:YggT family protein
MGDGRKRRIVSSNLIQLLSAAIQVYSLVLLARIIVSWIPDVSRSNPIVRFLYQATEPVLEPARRVIPPMGMLDISPIVVFIGLRILQHLLVNMAVGM